MATLQQIQQAKRMAVLRCIGRWTRCFAVKLVTIASSLGRMHLHGMLPPLNRYAIGKYDENRVGMYDSDLFDNLDNTIDGYGGRRTVHLRIDLSAPVGTPVHAFASGVVQSVGYNQDHGDYGYVIVFEHHLQLSSSYHNNNNNNNNNQNTTTTRRIWSLSMTTWTSLLYSERRALDLDCPFGKDKLLGDWGIFMKTLPLTFSSKDMPNLILGQTAHPSCPTKGASSSLFSLASTRMISSLRKSIPFLRLVQENNKSHKRNSINQQLDDEKYHEQLRLSKGLAEFSNAPSLRGPDEDDYQESTSYGDESVNVPPPPNYGERSFWERSQQNARDMKKPMLFGFLGLCLLILIVIILSVGFAMGSFQSGDNNSLSTNSAYTLEENDRGSRLRQYLMSVGKQDSTSSTILSLPNLKPWHGCNTTTQSRWIRST
ncbi:peptidase M23 family protein [Nitzschia inconspicua]|uniref:Peptidase M23 family protein n=1 Tax=Nitzschia inconspicua TaxID=303405 RepID=A0A9K3LNR5_9STRA|nr:peptidase M23 family protein [Nitzschia inconspicua]